jgi:hypothetical protein
MLENQLAPGLMRLKTKLSPGITTRPEGNTGERISKSDHLPHFRVVPEEEKNILKVNCLQKKSVVPISPLFRKSKWFVAPGIGDLC